MSNLWTYREGAMGNGHDVVGYDVEAVDGSIGKIDASTTDTDEAHVVVDTGWWIFGKKRLIPAGAIVTVDHQDQKVAVQMTKDQIKAPPTSTKRRRSRRSTAACTTTTTAPLAGNPSPVEPQGELLPGSGRQ